ncbi:MAG: bacteriorhodopsin-like [Brevundimonas sp.]|uniref:bacteriorhodopsin-like n=1 Tax=Brevundimonas sp. TaxID=1871086 RepID=UPI002717808A|nr:bacteriorhodopsin-like [Brevundimonas sp.]MDO9077276.1 bacteriorhodopsin-like [Brevundimonas sp.]MDP3081508.1 bacteriorhodopsin-like [Brevundimonas sp.]MDZ4060376.1 bacteriorhodopsin-like [Brevundimonas sp.]
MESMNLGQYELVYNAFSFSIATMAAATLFFWLSRDTVAPQYRAALVISGLVTFIAAYHYWRIFGSWSAAFVVDAGAGTVAPSGQKFNDAYRYVDWLLTVPLLLVELIIVMGLSRAATISKGVRLGVLAALMVALGYPGEIATDMSTRLLWGALSMVPFLFILFELFVGLRGSIKNQPEEARGLVNLAIWVTVLSWSFYPVVYFAPLLFGAGNANIATMSGDAAMIVQVGYTIADIVAKAAFGVLIFMIASAKSQEWRNKNAAVSQA